MNGRSFARHAILTALLSFSAAIHAAETGLAPPVVQRIEAEVERLMSEKDVPSYAVAVVNADGPLYARIFGMADRSTSRPADASTLYNIGSVTKTFTAALILILRDEGKLDLDDPWSKHLPPDVRTPVDADGKGATIRHLLKHVSGLERDPPNRKTGVSVKDLYKQLKRTKLEGTIGETWAYSNLGYGVLGHIAELVGGKRYEELLKERLLEPLEMSDTTITLSDAQRARLAPHYWGDDPKRKERAPWKWTDIVANGAITSSLDDMVRYAAFLLAPDESETPLSPAARADMLGEPIEPHDAGQATQRLAWFGSHVRGEGLWYNHGGEVDGHSAHVAFSRTDGLAVVVLSNLGNDAAAVLGEFLQKTAHEIAGEE